MAGNTPRQTILEVEYKGQDITKRIDRRVESFSYTDAENESDRISLNLGNIDLKWLNEWMPEKGDTIAPKIVKVDGSGKQSPLRCGDFLIDDISFMGSPLRCDIGGLSAPIDEGFKATENEKTWEGVSLRQVATDITARAGINLHFNVSDVQIDSIEQSKKTDAAFLRDLCDTYGYSMKVYANTLIIYQTSDLEKLPPVATLRMQDFAKWTYNTSIDGSYTGAVLTYTESKKEEAKTFTATVGDGKRILRLNEKCESDAEAEKIAIERVNRANEDIATLSVTLREPMYILSTQVVTVTGMGKMDGNYYIRRAQHMLSDRGYVVSLEMRKIMERIAKAAQEAPLVAAAAAAQKDHVVQKGDNLWKIAAKHYRNGAKYTLIYEANKDTIEAAAKKHGKSSSKQGHWIYPGTVLALPEV